jgi:hypothetical protein
MPATTKPASEILHRLLFRALLEMRERGRESKDKVVFHLTDLFHTVVLELAAAAEGKADYGAVIESLKERAREKGLGKWLEANLAELNS